MLSSLCRELLLLGKARPWVFDDARAALGGDFACLINRARIDNHDFVRPGDGFASRANVPGFVESDDGDGDFQGRSQSSEVGKNGTRIEALVEVRQHVGEMRRKEIGEQRSESR